MGMEGCFSGPKCFTVSESVQNTNRRGRNLDLKERGTQQSVLNVGRLSGFHMRDKACVRILQRERKRVCVCMYVCGQRGE